jgi:uncharacterized membrane protein (DUF4010 family)
MLAFVVYPVLPPGTVDPWGLVEPRPAWITVLLIAGLGFTNYILLKLYGARGVEFIGFLGGLVNSTVTVTELTQRARAANGKLADVTYRGVVLATAAMLIRNAVILGLLAPLALLDSIIPHALMIAGAAIAVLLNRERTRTRNKQMAEIQSDQQLEQAPPLPALESPFSLTAAIKCGIIFLALEILGTLAQRALGQVGFYAVSTAGGLVSSASAVASAANLAAAGTLPPQVAANGAVIASATSAIINLPLVARLAGDRIITLRTAWVLGGITLLGAVGCVFQALLSGNF